MATTAEDVLEACSLGKIVVAFDLEGSAPLLNDIALVSLYRDLGVRQMTLVYNRGNLVGGGCHDSIDDGLTAFGHLVVRAINNAGVVLDCSHTGEMTSLQAMKCSSDPVVFSHANVRALVDHPRNLSDRQIDACAETGGVVGVTACDLFVGNQHCLAKAMVAHIDYIVQRVGPAHAGIGLDHVYALGIDDIPGAVSASNGMWATDALSSSSMAIPPWWVRVRVGARNTVESLKEK